MKHGETWKMDSEPQPGWLGVGHNEYDAVRHGPNLPQTQDALMSRDELLALTGTKQPKRMCAWLEARNWAHEPPARRGEIPRVLRSYRDARMSSVTPARERRADYSFMTARSA